MYCTRQGRANQGGVEWTRLEELVDDASRGEEVILTQKGKPVARIIPFGRRVERRVFGSAKGLIHIREGFDEPLEDFRTL